jgi:hypothetical protein
MDLCVFHILFILFLIQMGHEAMSVLTVPIF